MRWLRARPLAIPACALLSSLSRSPPTSACAADVEGPRFSFGVIADIQYCDCDDAYNFAGTEARAYRATLAQTTKAVDTWNAAAVAFVAQLGDLIDGQNAGKYGAGLLFERPKSQMALDGVISELSRCDAPIYHAIGNHELYNFDWAALRQNLNRAELSWRVAPDEPACEADCSFVIRPTEGWTLIMLNAYEVSLMQDEKLDGYKKAVQLMQEYNPNNVMGDNQAQVNYFKDLNGRKQKYVPFNGGLGERQMRWLRKEVVSARERRDRIIVLSHLPMLAEASSHRTLLFDCDEALRILHEDGCGHVVAVIAGHLHRGGYALDNEGLHHVTMRSPLSHKDCFGIMRVYENRLELAGNGDQPSFTMPFPPLQVIPSTATPSAMISDHPLMKS